MEDWINQTLWYEYSELKESGKSRIELESHHVQLQKSIYNVLVGQTWPKMAGILEQSHIKEYMVNKCIHASTSQTKITKHFKVHIYIYEIRSNLHFFNDIFLSFFIFFFKIFNTIFFIIVVFWQNIHTFWSITFFIKYTSSLIFVLQSWRFVVWGMNRFRLSVMNDYDYNEDGAMLWVLDKI